MPNEKDSTEKHLLNYADVFADVVNVLVFHGKEVIDPKDLVSTEARSVLTLHGKTCEQERDVVKIWTKGNTKIALVGLENQTLQPLRRESPLREGWECVNNNNRFLDVAYEIDTRGPINMKDLIGNMLTDSEHKGELKGTVDCVVNLIRSTKGNTNLNDALEMLKVPADIRDAVAEQAKSILAE